MAINVSVKRRITVNGKEFASLDEMPADLRAAFEKAMAGGAIVTAPVKTHLKITFNGKQYGSVDEMPPSEQALYRTAMAAAEGQSVAQPVLASVAGLAPKPTLFRRLFPKTLAAWVEPKAVRRARERTQKGSRIWWFILAAAIGAVVASANPQMSFSRSLVLGVVVAAAILGMLALARITPISIRLREDGIARTFGKETTLWRWEDIVECEIATTDIGGRPVSVLLLQPAKGERVILGMPETMQREAVRMLLEGRGVKVVMKEVPQATA